MKTFSATYRDFVRFDVKPNEDAFLISKKLPIFAVADGVTQSHYKNGRYALPYGAKLAAKIFCKSTVKYLEKSYSHILENVRIKNIIKESFDLANQKIRELNVKHGLVDKRMDYLQHDWFDTVGVTAVLVKNTLHYGFVGDCGLAIFNKNNKKIFQTKDMVAPAIKRFEKMYSGHAKFSFDKRTFIVRHDFRNNPDKTGYGSFTGEEHVRYYYAFGAKKLQKGDMVVLYSDGMVNLLKDGEFIKILRLRDKTKLTNFVMQKAKENSKKYGDDRTFALAVV